MHLEILLIGIEYVAHWPGPSRSFGHLVSGLEGMAFNVALAYWWRPAKGCYMSQRAVTYTYMLEFIWWYMVQLYTDITWASRCLKSLETRVLLGESTDDVYQITKMLEQPVMSWFSDDVIHKVEFSHIKWNSVCPLPSPWNHKCVMVFQITGNSIVFNFQ